jgi:hypothetical protein
MNVLFTRRRWVGAKRAPRFGERKPLVAQGWVGSGQLTLGCDLRFATEIALQDGGKRD